MSKQQQDVSTSRQRKKDQFTEGTPVKRKAVVLAALFAVVLIAVAGYFVLRPGEGASAGDGTEKASIARAAVTDGEIRIPLADLAPGEAKFFDHAPPSANSIRFLVLNEAAGVYRAALDACEICYRAKKGYFQRGDELVCRQCGNSYAPALIDESPGGCHPIALPRRVEGEYLVINAADVQSIDAQHASRPAGPRRMMNGAGQGLPLLRRQQHNATTRPS